MTLPRAAFERGVRRLDGPTARAFVADLLGARGFRTTVEGRIVTATSDTSGSMRLLVVADGRSLAAVGLARSVDAVLLTGGPVAVAVGSLLVRAAVREDRPAVLDAETLYEWFVYAVDADAQVALEDRYLGSTEPSTIERMGVALADAVSNWADRPGRSGGPSVRTAVVLVALFAVVTVVTAGPLDAFGPSGTSPRPAGGDDAGGTPGLSAVPSTVIPPSPTTESGSPVLDVCPPAPVDAHPASLRPGVIQTASTGGLEGWRVLVTQNLSEHAFDPNDQRARLAPVQRHVVVFETSGRETVRLGIDRWESPARAEAAVARGGPWRLGIPWGAYVAWVELEPEGSESTAREVLAAVGTPGEARLGSACVTTLLTGAGSGGTG